MQFLFESNFSLPMKLAVVRYLDRSDRILGIELSLHISMPLQLFWELFSVNRYWPIFKRIRAQHRNTCRIQWLWTRFKSLLALGSSRWNKPLRVERLDYLFFADSFFSLIISVTCNNYTDPLKQRILMFSNILFHENCNHIFQTILILTFTEILIYMTMIKFSKLHRAIWFWNWYLETAVFVAKAMDLSSSEIH